MSLLDLKSDLSKYRYKGSKAAVDPNSKTPRATNYGDNFGSFQPISNTLIRGPLPIINEPKEIDLIDKLSDTRLDNIIQEKIESMLINSVSEFSRKDTPKYTLTAANVSIENIVSKLSKINTDTVLSSIDKSDTRVTKVEHGIHNNKSKIEIVDNGSERDNIVNPNVVLDDTPLFMDRESQSVVINKNLISPINNILNPNIALKSTELTTDKESEAVLIDKDSKIKDIIVDSASNKLLNDSFLNLDNIPDKVNTESKIVLKKITQTIDTARYNGQISELAISDSVLNLDDIKVTVTSGRHETDKNTKLSNVNGQEVDYFTNNNANGFTNNAQPLLTEYETGTSVLGFEDVQEANYFDITNQYTTDGFSTFAQPYDTKYVLNASKFDWDGNIDKAPTVNYFDVTKNYTTSGFTSFAKEYDTKYVLDSSRFDWDGTVNNAPAVNYFDLSYLYTNRGFHTFAKTKEETSYKNDGVTLAENASEFDWGGTVNNAPAVNYFDLSNQSTYRGFHPFSKTLEETSYQNDGVTLLENASRFDWDGTVNNVPNVNYFDISNQSTYRGFHSFAQTLEETSYQNDGVTLLENASRFDWDGTVNNAPSVNYFDLSNQSTYRGFHPFAQTKEDTSYQNDGVTLLEDASRFDWDGTINNAPAVNYFDISKRYTSRGFHPFAKTQEPTSYNNDGVTLDENASVFDWGGTVNNAPSVNYFDLSKRYTSRGFHPFAKTLEETSYQNDGVTLLEDASNFDWGGTVNNAPSVNYFDLSKRYTSRGFHPFAQTKEETSYQNDGVMLLENASDFDWDGTVNNAPNVNYFDIANRSSYRGFHSFAQTKEETSYQNNGVNLLDDATIFDWNGTNPNAPSVNYFDLSKRYTSRGFHPYAQTKEPTSYQNDGITLLENATFFDWNGQRGNAPFVNYFDLGNVSSYRGFHPFARTKETTSYQHETYGSAEILKTDASQLDWYGLQNTAPSVNYFDISNRATYRGFHTFSQTNEPTSYQNDGVILLENASDFDWDGTVNNAPSVNYFDLTNRSTYRGFHTLSRTLEPTSYKTNGSLLEVDASRFDWDGTVNNVPTVNYFDLANRSTYRGFHSFAQPRQQTSYQTEQINGIPVLKDTATFIDWYGTRQSAPTLNYFDQINLFTTAGFHSFSTTKENTKFKQDASQFDWDGINVLGVNPTRYFGFIPSETYGFMVRMSQLDGTTYPIINPTLPYTLLTPEDLGIGLNQLSIRGGIKQMRIVNEPLQTTNLEKYVPVTLGNKFISGFKATLDNQSPVVNVQKYGFNITGFRRRGKTSGQLVDITGNTFGINSQSKFIQNQSSQRYTEGGAVNERPSYVDGGMEIWANSPSVTSPDQTFSVGNTNLTAAQLVALNRSFNGMPIYNGKTYKSHIDYQYSKYNLVKDSFNTDINLPQPFVDTSINGEYNFNTFLIKLEQRLNTAAQNAGSNINLDETKQKIKDTINFINVASRYDEGIVRGGIGTNLIRTALDTERITKFLLSSKGILWNAKQLGLQFMNPNVDTSPGIKILGLQLPGGMLGRPWTQIYNPLSVPMNVMGKSAIGGGRYSRHGIFMDGPGGYGNIAIEREVNSNKPFEQFTSPSFFNRTGDYNRLIGLTKELLPNSYEPVLINKLPGVNGNATIERLSSVFGGPDSTLGVFGTSFYKATHPYKVFNTTIYSPRKQSILTGQEREVFFSGKESTSKVNNLPSSSYGAYLYSQMNESGAMKGLILALVDYIVKPRPSGPTKPGKIDENDAPYGIQKVTSNKFSGYFNFRYQNDTEKVRPMKVDDFRFRRFEMSDGPIDGDSETIKRFKTTPYSSLKLDDQNKYSKNKFNDFRKSIPDNTIWNGTTFITDPNVSDYKQNNLENIDAAGNGVGGFGNPGTPGRRRNLPFVSNIEYRAMLSREDIGTIKSNYKYASFPIVKQEVENGLQPGISAFGGDRINIIDWKRSIQDLNENYVYELNQTDENGVLLPGTKDLIQFYFSGPNLAGSEYVPTEAIVFRAYLDTIVDNHKPSWSPIKYIGRADPVYSYDGYERDIQFGFTVHIGSRDELKASWRKLNMLASWTAPEYIENGFMKAPVVRLNIGNLYRKFPGYIGSLSYTFDNTQTTWETAKLAEDKNLSGENKWLTMPGALELPKTINVQCSFVPFNIYRPEWDCVFYSLFDDSTGGAGIETGLVPISDDRVNYFRTFDDLPSTHVMNSVICAITGSEPPKPKVEPKKEPEPEPIPKPKPKCLCKIDFCLDEDRFVTPESNLAIQELANWLKTECPNVKIELAGHTSREQNHTEIFYRYNKLLGQARADTIKRILEETYSIDQSRITAVGKGYDELIQGIDPKDQRNRRVTVKITNENEATCGVILNFDCPDKTGCGTSTVCKRDTAEGYSSITGAYADKSKFWIVGPGYFTVNSPTKIDDSYELGLGGYWGPDTSKGVQDWKQLWKDKSYKIRSYSDTRKDANGYGTYYGAPTR
jgi:hypothetical protein